MLQRKRTDIFGDIAITHEFVPTECSYKGAKLKLSRQLQIMLHTILAAGEKGVSYSELIIATKSNATKDAQDAMRVRVSEINREFKYHGFKHNVIRSKRGICYWVAYRNNQPTTNNQSA